MSLRSASESWGNGGSFAGEGLNSLESRHSHLRSSANNGSSAFFSFSNTHGFGGDTQATTTAAAARHGSTSFDWLVPWRTPQDCREGGLALLCSMQEIVFNVRRARQSSMQEVYAPVRHGSPGSTSMRVGDDAGDDPFSASATLRLSMRNSKRRPQPMDDVDGDVRSNSLSSEAASTAHASAPSRQATLLDYLLPRSGSDGATRRTSLMWLDDAKTPPSAAISPCDTTSIPRSLQGEREEEEAVEDGVAANASTARAAEAVGHGLALPSPPVSTTPADRIPAIPRFDELKALQEEYQQQLQAQQQPHPRSEAAQRKRHALQHSSDDEERDESRDSSPHGYLQETARVGPGVGDGTARPAAAPVTTDVAARPAGPSRSSSFSEVLSADDDDDCSNGADDDLSDHMSATNFGEGGHLACVPGDTLHNRYSLLKPLGVGRSSRVWLAADLEQCSLARRHLIRELGEREARRLFRPAERPMFVAIKVFRCSDMYTDCADYEAKLSTFVKDSVRLRQLRPPLRSPRSRSASLVVSPTAGDGGSFTSAAGVHVRRSATPPQPPTSPTAGSSNASSSAYNSGSAALASRRLTTFRDAFTVAGAYGTHRCLVMDVLGSGVDTAINEAHLAGFPSEVARAILLSSLQGLSVLAACHVIHTDLKPENLLFTDLEAEVAAEMRNFQSSQLQTGQRSGLWSSFTHRRENVRRYSRRREREARQRDSDGDAPSAAAAHMGEEGRTTRPTSSSTSFLRDGPPDDAAMSLSNSGSVGYLQHTCAPGHQQSLQQQQHTPKATRDDVIAALSINSGGSSNGGIAAVKEKSGSSRLTSPLLSATRRGRTSTSSQQQQRGRRPAYEVRVSDFGLSFITPPCLRLGVRAMARYTDDIGITEDELVRDDALSQLQWLYDQQQQHRRAPTQQTAEGTSPRGSRRGSGGSSAEWVGETELIDEAELMALQREAAYEDDLRVRRASDGAAPASEEGQRVVGGAGGEDAAAVGFTSVTAIGVAAEEAAAPQHTRRDPQQPLMPQHTREYHHSSDSVDDSLVGRRDGALGTVDSGLLEHLAASATTEVAAAPPMALCTASYHSPVLHPLTALPSTAVEASSPPEQEAAKVRVDATPKPRHTVKNGERSGDGDINAAADTQEDSEAWYATPPPATSPLRCAPALLSGRSSAVSETDAVTNTTVTAAPAHTVKATNEWCTGSGSTSSLQVQHQHQHQQLPTLLSPRQRRSPTSALASLTALRRLELDIVRNQHYTRGATIQSREYRSPEVLLGNFFLPSCDVWSIGCIAYELVTGRFLLDCIADRAHVGRQLARHRLREESGGDGGDEEDVQWDGQPIYVDDEEQDLDVFHLKAMMRLLGPPPISFLRQKPTGLFVEDYFDDAGRFRFWDPGEAEECGMDQVEAHRKQELRYWSQQRKSSGNGCAGDTAGGSSRSGTHAALRACTTAGSSYPNNSYYHDDGGDETDDADARRDEEEAVARVRPYNSLRGFEDAAAQLFSSSDIPGRGDYRGTPSTDATPSTISMTPRSIATSAISTYLRSATNGAPTTLTSASAAAAAAASPSASPQDTRNYPIETADWREVRQILRRKLPSEAEARDFEGFLAKCLVWDPAHRASAAELLNDDWIVKYGHMVALAVDSDGDEEDDDGAMAD